MSSSRKSKPLLTKPAQLAVDSNQRIIVNDSGANLIKIFDFQGKFLNEFNPAKKAGAMVLEDQQRGVCVEHAGSILVALHHNHSIARFSADGDFIEHVLTQGDGLRYPVGIVAGVENLAVTEVDRASKHAAVKVLKLQ